MSDTDTHIKPGKIYMHRSRHAGYLCLQITDIADHDKPPEHVATLLSLGHGKASVHWTTSDCKRTTICCKSCNRAAHSKLNYREARQ